MTSKTRFSVGPDQPGAGVTACIEWPSAARLLSSASADVDGADIQCGRIRRGLHEAVVAGRQAGAVDRIQPWRRVGGRRRLEAQRAAGSAGLGLATDKAVDAAGQRRQRRADQLALRVGAVGQRGRRDRRLRLQRRGRQAVVGGQPAVRAVAELQFDRHRLVGADIRVVQNGREACVASVSLPTRPPSAPPLTVATVDAS